ncbi:phosphate uptake regulator PhoU [Candidatus Thorarchaeota archaeon]|nr:MAG: phosphate uptake regulator PhoU [Candidatus Thorarchaeota archaeon]
MTPTTRKLNQVRNSFYVYLPRGWCEEYKLTKESEVQIERTLDGSLRISPTTTDNSDTEPLKLTLTNEQAKDIVNLLVGAYIVGTNKLELTFEDGLDMTTRGEISKWIRRLPGFEIFDEHSNSFVLSDTSEKQVITPILRQQFATTKYMLNGLLHMIESGDIENHTRIIDRDEDVDRHRYFVERLCHMILRDPAYARKIALSSPDALSFSLAAKYVERIADHICAAILELVQLKTTSPKMKKIAGDIIYVFEDTRTAFFSIDTTKRKGKKLDIAESSENALKTLNKATLLAEALQKEGSSRREKTTHEIVLFLHLERITSYCADIVEVGINRIIASGL